MHGARCALIVATDQYADLRLGRLRAPASDARALEGVLVDPGIGDFEVRTVLNEPAHVINLAVEEFFADRRPSDLLLVHISGHGIKNESGELYFAASNTLLDRLGATAVAAEFVSRQMNRSRSRRVVLLLDCCYAGAFERSLVARAGEAVGIEQQFGGRGRAVITASNAMEYAFEEVGQDDSQELRPSVFTSALVEGLETGEADHDQDGMVGLDELYEYVYEKVRAATPNQTPGKWVFGVEGELYIARRGRPVTTPAPLPSELQLAIESPLAGVRAGVVQELSRLLRGSHAGMALAARRALEQLADDDSRAVGAAAIAVLSTPASAAAPGPPLPELIVSDKVIDLGRVPLHGQSPEHRVRVSNAGGGNLNARAAASASWLRLRHAGDELLITVDTSSAGEHEGIVTVDSDGGTADIRVLVRMDPSLVPAAGTVAGRGSQLPPRALASVRSSLPVIIEHQIGAALAARAAQRESVADLLKSWEHLTDEWTHLVASAHELGVRAADARSALRAESDVFTDLADYLAVDADWRQRAASVMEKINHSTARVRTLYRRVHRDTVNIGVIGQTHSGKSTLLRKLSGLDGEQIPSNQFSSTTATPNRIFHEPGSGPGRAVLSLHTWESFRAEVLVPLHELTRLPEQPPISLMEFRRFHGYRDPRDALLPGHSGAERYRRRLRQAQDSLPSYEDLLHGGIREISVNQLRPFIAYPPDGGSQPDYRPFYAVRSADVFCEFPEVGAISLGLVDLPGMGDAGLDVHGQFLTELRNNIDLLFIVKRPERAPVSESDWDVMTLADDAAAGVRRSDFAYQVINRDARLPGEYFASAMARAKVEAEQLGIDVLDCDLASATPAQVAEVLLLPVLANLAERLAFMDRDAAQFIVTNLVHTAAQMQSLTDELGLWIERRQNDLPDEQQRLRARIREMKNAVTARLSQVRDNYYKADQSGAPIGELNQEVEKAQGEIRKWFGSGLGAGSTQEWLRRFDLAVASAGMDSELDTQYNSARKEMIAAFSVIDNSMDRLIDRIWGEVADALRARLTSAIVPIGSENQAILNAFADTARRAGARTLAEAIERILHLPTEYGSVFLRVGRPLISKIAWNREDLQPELIANVADSQASTPSGTNLEATATAESTHALRWHARLGSTIEQVLGELSHEFNAEARRTLLILGAAVDDFLDIVARSPDMEMDFEKLTRPVQQEIWPEDFGGPAAGIAAQLAALRQRVGETDAAAAKITSLAGEVRRFYP